MARSSTSPRRPKLALPTYGAYAATKGSVDALTPILAEELRGRDVTVNAVAPGPTATPLFLQGGKDQATIDHLAVMAPLQRLGQPADIAETVAFLAGPGRWVDGRVLYADGGVVSSGPRPNENASGSRPPPDRRRHRTSSGVGGRTDLLHPPPRR